MNTIDSLLNFIAERFKEPFGIPGVTTEGTFKMTSFFAKSDGICVWVSNPKTPDFSFLEISCDGEKIGFAESTEGRKMSITLPIKRGCEYTVNGDNSKWVSFYFYPFSGIEPI